MKPFDNVNGDRAKSSGSQLLRRDFLGGLAALGVAAVLPERASPAQTRTPSTAASGTYRLIDTHHHFSSPGYKEATARLTGTAKWGDWTPKQSIEDMDKAGVGTAVVSYSEPIVWYGDEEGAKKLSRECNEFTARMMTDYPGRFGMFTALPLPYVDLALREIEYGLDTLKAEGVNMMTNYQGKYLGDPAFAPVMDELNRRKAIIQIHPAQPVNAKDLLPGWGGGIELSTETTRSIASVVFSGTASRYPDIRFIWAHAGGSMPYLYTRFVAVAQGKDVQPRLPKGLLYELQKFYYDTAQVYNPYTLAAFSKMIPTSHMLFGTDFPVVSAGVTLQGIKDAAVFSASDLQAIGRDNALALFPRLKTVARQA
jgi:predicted TIM-barrel fold metal-dependent hydrolase